MIITMSTIAHNTNLTDNFGDLLVGLPREKLHCLHLEHASLLWSFRQRTASVLRKMGPENFGCITETYTTQLNIRNRFLVFLFVFFLVCFFWGWGLSNLFQLRDFWLLVSNRHVFFLIANGQIPTTPPIWWNHFPVDKSIHFYSSYPHKRLVRCLLLSNLETPAARSIRN